MRLALLLIPLLLFGCISFGERMANNTNGTSGNGTNVTMPANATGNATQNGTLPTNITQNDTNATQPAQKQWERFMYRDFSFEYPFNMSVQSSEGTSSGIFTGTHELDGQTGEILIVTYINTRTTYGANKDEIFRDNPSKTASDFLIQDTKDDPAGSMLSEAFEVGEIKTFFVARDGAVAETPFRIRFSDSNKSYYGYAMDIYIPERSIHSKMRVIALDAKKAKEIRDEFLLGFRIE